MADFFCPFCGNQLAIPADHASLSISCGRCLNQASIPVSLLPAARQADRFSATHTLDGREALTFPFRRPDWLSRLGWLAFVNFVPVLNLILLRGWRLDLTRRVGYGDPQPLPDLKDVGNFLGNGVILWTMTFLYNLPLFIIVLFLERDLPGNLWRLAVYFFNLLTDGEGASAAVFVELVARIAGQAIIPGLYALFAWPLYRAAMLRFAMTGSPGAFLKPVANLRLVVRHLNLFFLLFFFDLLSQTLLTVVGGALTAIGIGFLLVPAVLLPMYYWTTGHLYGQVAAALAPELAGRN